MPISGVASAYFVQALIRFERNQPEAAEHFAQQAIAFARQFQSSGGMVRAHILLAKIANHPFAAPASVTSRNPIRLADVAENATR